MNLSMKYSGTLLGTVQPAVELQLVRCPTPPTAQRILRTRT